MSRVTASLRVFTELQQATENIIIVDGLVKGDGLVFNEQSARPSCTILRSLDQWLQQIVVQLTISSPGSMNHLN